MMSTNKPKRYKAILVDPPWSYNDKCHSGKRGVEYKYSTMKLSDLKRLNVQNISDDNCAMFMWVTAPQMEAGLELMEAWGFQYKTIAFTWIKHYPKSGKLCWGMGNYTRANAEFVLLGVKGKPMRVDAGVHSVVNAPRGKHSAKPHEVNERIVRLLGDVPRIEMFARHSVDGWDVWGDEVDCDLEIAMWPKLEYQCPECESNKVEEKFYTNLNTDKTTKNKDNDPFYCNKCKEHIEYVMLVDKATGAVKNVHKED
jgi:N6-adenosine-specific RNA methylase IME4